MSCTDGLHLREELHFARDIPVSNLFVCFTFIVYFIRIIYSSNSILKITYILNIKNASSLTTVKSMLLP